jgi:hypothetical protein
VTGDSPLPCVRCGRELESVMADHAPRQPYAATVFLAHGQYGSTVFDPSPHSRQFLECNICDQCVTECAATGTIVLGMTIPCPSEVTYQAFNPEVDGAD